MSVWDTWPIVPVGRAKGIEEGTPYGLEAVKALIDNGGKTP